MNDPAVAELRTHLEVVTEALCRAEERAIAGQLALEMLHEIRNPLEAIGHLTYLTSQDAGNDHKVREYMALAEEQMNLLRHIASQTLGFAKTSAASKPIDLVAIAEAALRIHQRSMKDKKVRLVKDLPDKLVAPGYHSELLQALSNLLMNALESMESDGTICLRLRKQGGDIQLVVSDSGHGIATDHIASLFKPFFTTKGDHGNGLGLALTKKIVDHHGGKIRVKSSVRPNRSGTTFRISLPAS